MNFKRNHEIDGLVWDVFDKTGNGAKHLAQVTINAETLEPTIRLVDGTENDKAGIRKAVPRITNKLKRERLKILIVCEGETEQRYIIEVCRALKIGSRVDVIKGTSTSPGRALQDVGRDLLWAKQVKAEVYSEAWLVFDRDSHADFHEACRNGAFFSNVHLALSNPCLEYWFLLHAPSFDPKSLLFDGSLTLDTVMRRERVNENTFRVVTEQIVEEITKPQTCIDLLGRYFPAYRKNAAEGYLQLFAPTIKTAYYRAANMNDPERGHGSGIPKLIDRLCAMAEVTPEDFMTRLVTKSTMSQTQSSASKAETVKGPAALSRVSADKVTLADFGLASRPLIGKAFDEAIEALNKESQLFQKDASAINRITDLQRFHDILKVTAEWVADRTVPAGHEDQAGPTQETAEKIELITRSPCIQTLALFSTSRKAIRPTVGTILKDPHAVMKTGCWQRFFDAVLICFVWLMKRLEELASKSNGEN